MNSLGSVGALEHLEVSQDFRLEVHFVLFVLAQVEFLRGTVLEGSARVG